MARVGDKRGEHRILVGSSDGTSSIVDEAAWIGLLSLRIGSGGGRCECGN